MAPTPRSPARGAALLRAVGLRRVADDATILLDDLSVELDSGERLALSGPSGSGKSLLLRALVMLDPVDGGHVEWQGSEPAPENVPDFRRRVLFLAQSPMVEEGTVAAQLERPWRFAAARGGRFDLRRATELLAIAGRDARFLDQDGSTLSGGEAQLMALVRALLLEPTVLLLDEPTAAMDARTREAAEGLLAHWLAADPRRSWIWVSHDPEQLARTCDRSLRLENGRRVG